MKKRTPTPQFQPVEPLEDISKRFCPGHLTGNGEACNIQERIGRQLRRWQSVTVTPSGL